MINKVKGTGQLCVVRDGVELELSVDNNMLLDGFFNHLMTTADPTSSTVFKVGTGSDDTVESMTALVSPVSVTSWVQGSTVSDIAAVHDVGNNTMSATLITEARFSTGAIVGNITEWGVDYFSTDTSAADGSVNCRIRIRDINGDPATLTVLATDELVLRHSIAVTSPAEADSSLTIPTPSGDLTVGVKFLHARYPKVMEMVSWQNGSKARVSESKQDTQFTVISAYETTVTDSTIEQVSTLQSLFHNSFSAGVGNFSGGIQTLQLSGVSTYKVVFDTPIPKVDGDIFKFTSRMILERA